MDFVRVVQTFASVHGSFEIDSKHAMEFYIADQGPDTAGEGRRAVLLATPKPHATLNPVLSALTPPPRSMPFCVCFPPIFHLPSGTLRPVHFCRLPFDLCPLH